MRTHKDRKEFLLKQVEYLKEQINRHLDVDYISNVSKEKRNKLIIELDEVRSAIREIEHFEAIFNDKDTFDSYVKNLIKNDTYTSFIINENTIPKQ